MRQGAFATSNNKTECWREEKNTTWSAQIISKYFIPITVMSFRMDALCFLHCSSVLLTTFYCVIKYPHKKTQKLKSHLSHQCHVLLQIVIKKWILWPLEGWHQFISLGISFVFFLPKMRKKYDNITFNFQQKNYIQKIIFIYFWY